MALRFACSGSEAADLEAAGDPDENAAVVCPQPVTAPERVAVGLLHRGPGGRSDMRKEQGRSDVPGELPEVRVRPGGLDAAEQGRYRVPLAVPADAEAVGVEGGRAHRRRAALVDERVRGPGHE